MKNLQTILFLLFVLSCKAQTHSIYMGPDEIDNHYYKDIDNDFNKFEGRWLYTNGNTSLEIIFKKRSNIFDPYRNFYADELVGEFKYVQDGVLMNNTLANINTSASPYRNMAFSGNSLTRCDACLPGQRDLIQITFFDNIADLSKSVSVRHLLDSGVEKLRITFRVNMTWGTAAELPVIPPGYLTILDGQYILTKVP
jgi:hypothetical protein